MMRPVKLRGRVYLENNRTLTFHSTTFDETPFHLTVDQFDVELNESFTPKKRWVDGWLFVQQEAQQGSVCYLTLPKPTIVHGHQISVRDFQLMPINASIEDFKKPVPQGTKLPAPDVKLPAVEELKEVESLDVDDDPFTDLPEDEPINLDECVSTGKCCG